MRGADRQTAAMFTYASQESLVPKDHAPRAIRPLVNAALERLSGAFVKLYSPFGRDSIAPEKLMRALLLQAFFSIRSERQLMEQVTYNMMFRWFVGLAMDAPVWDVTVSTKNRDRLLEGDIARAFLVAILSDPQVVPLLSNEHFSVDGTLIQAWASMKSFKPKDGKMARANRLRAAAAVHGVLPCLFRTYASSAIIVLYQRLRPDTIFSVRRVGAPTTDDGRSPPAPCHRGRAPVASHVPRRSQALLQRLLDRSQHPATFLPAQAPDFARRCRQGGRVGGFRPAADIPKIAGVVFRRLRTSGLPRRRVPGPVQLGPGGGVF